jgi:hypothetical protein
MVIYFSYIKLGNNGDGMVEIDTTRNARFANSASNPVGEGFANRVSEFLLGNNRWCFK